MNYLNIHTDNLRSEEFIGADPAERGVWVSLIGWCVSQECSGVIHNSKTWNSRKWQQLCGVTKEEVEMDSGLFYFKGDDLHVSFYPIEQEATCKARREAGKKGGRPKKNKEEKPQGLGEVNLEDTLEANHERNVKKRKEKKRKEIIEEIYQAYPLKKSKANALKAIEKALTKIDHEPLFEIVQTYAKARTLPNGKCANYTPHPATWFNGECWEDDQDTWLIDELRLENNEPKNPW